MWAKHPRRGAGALPPQCWLKRPPLTATSQNTITVWYYDGAISETVEGFKRANTTIEIDLKKFGDADKGYCAHWRAEKGYRM